MRRSLGDAGAQRDAIFFVSQEYGGGTVNRTLDLILLLTH